jgi:hypothetical protein
MSKRLRIVLIAVALIMAAIAVWVRWFARTIDPRVRARVVEALNQRFDASVTLASLHVSFFPQPEVSGAGLSIRHKDWPDSAPLIYIQSFSAATDWSTLWSSGRRVKLIQLKGLQIRVPPRGASAFKDIFTGGEEVASGEAGHDTTHLPFSIETIRADGTLLEIEPKVPGKEPLDFEIRKLTLYRTGTAKAMRFRAQLTNAKPPGLIDCDGYFGPWQKDDPRATAVSGTYRFSNANLSVFSGIGGILHSTGMFTGVLQHIETSGTTGTPNFSLKGGGNAVDLKTNFHAIVNGTDGDTILNPVEATFLHSKFVCRGAVAGKQGAHGKTVSLQAVTHGARMEDILALVVGGDRPFLTGNVQFNSTIVIPPGPQDVIDKLKLQGAFEIASAVFTNPQIERKLITLSDRARGIPKNEQEELEREGEQKLVASDFHGRMKLDCGVASFSQLSFAVPGADISLKGTYELQSQKIEMDGLFRMQATLSQTQSGVKRWMLLPFNKLFEHDGAGFAAPIKITGTTDHPVLALDILHHEITVE